ncbi:D-arabinono-1,4-lactone oxidase [Saccharomycopsis crataegensis]|uniref:D-arabinono-1,4-lactone oxidase n=1 Tax=Saccharomycopsis crataegensis TaxID=43959 RepID=A0AAV5QKC3_9ASCO|nr:D-arabinono-1,4-lactone oxidase [Saccharomycopsis crataegensis]
MQLPSLPSSLVPITSTKHIHQTWAKTFTTKPDYYFQPRNVAEVRQVVNFARENGARIVCVGSVHSPSDLAVEDSKSRDNKLRPGRKTDGDGETYSIKEDERTDDKLVGLDERLKRTAWVMNLDFMDKIVDISWCESGKGRKSKNIGSVDNNEPNINEKIDVDSSIENIKYCNDFDYADITVQAGIRIYQLNNSLASLGLAFQNLGNITDQSIAGLIGTGSHGSTAYQGPLDRQVLELWIMDSQGEVWHCSELKNVELFRAGLVSLGKIGIIVAVKLRFVKKFKIGYRIDVVGFGELSRLWPNLWTASEFVRVWWYPYTEKCVIWRGWKMDNNNNNGSGKNKLIPAISSLVKKLIKVSATAIWKVIHEVLLYICIRYYPSSLPILSRYVFWKEYGKAPALVSLYGIDTDELTVKDSTDAFAVDCLYSQYVNEWAIPIDDGVNFLETFNNVIDEAKNNNQWYIHDPVELRCSNHSINEQVSVPSSEGITSQWGATAGNSVGGYLDATQKGKEVTLYVNLVTYRPLGYPTKHGRASRAFESLCVEHGGLPHWAKNFIGSKEYYDDDNDDDNDDDDDNRLIGYRSLIIERYGDDLKQWQKVRLEMDRQGVFISSYGWCLRNGLL